MSRIRTDYETRSLADLKEVGQHRYAIDPSTRALCIAIEDCVYDLSADEKPDPPQAWIDAVRGGHEIHSWNVGFEYEITTHVLSHWPQPNPEMWRDTAFKALCCGMPGSLELCAEALRIPQTKHEDGKRLIRMFSLPGKDGLFTEPRSDLSEYGKFLSYCQQDGVVLAAIDAALPDPSSDEIAFWLATWETNREGVPVDRRLVSALRRFADRGFAAAIERLDAVEGLGFEADKVASNHGAVLKYVQGTGLDIQSVAKARVREALTLDMTDDARTVLETRQELGRSSVKSLDNLMRRVGYDGRLRHCYVPHGTATGRDSGRGFNQQNIPRGEKMNVEALVAAALADDYDAFMVAAVAKGKTKPDPIGGVVTCLRGCLSAGEGNVLHQCDWSAIEPRYGAWLVGDKSMLAAFHKIDKDGGFDIYQHEGATLYRCEPAEITGDKRQRSKVYVLQNQYESGEASIQRAAKDMYGVVMTLEEALHCKTTWRETHPLWVSCWRDLEQGAILAVRNPGKVVQTGKVAWIMRDGHLRLRLPSGRIIWFPWAQVVLGMTPWGKEKEMLSYEFRMEGGKKWVRDTTHGGALFNVAVQGGCADLFRYAVRNLRRRGFKVRIRVHDELVVEGPDSQEYFDAFKKTMLEVPAWADGLPINGAGWTGPRYRKD